MVKETVNARQSRARAGRQIKVQRRLDRDSEYLGKGYNSFATKVGRSTLPDGTRKQWSGQVDRAFITSQNSKFRGPNAGRSSPSRLSPPSRGSKPTGTRRTKRGGR